MMVTKIIFIPPLEDNRRLVALATSEETPLERLQPLTSPGFACSGRAGGVVVNRFVTGYALGRQGHV